MTPWTPFKILSLALGAAVCAAAAPHAPEEPVDRSVALVVGEHRVSQYGLQKNFRQFADGAGRPHAVLVEKDVADWFGRFLERQVLMAEARRRGYFERPEVVDLVDRMSRYMLTRPSDGMLFRSLPREAGATDEQVYRDYRARRLGELQFDYEVYAGVELLALLQRQRVASAGIPAPVLGAMADRRLCGFAGEAGGRLTVGEFAAAFNRLLIRRLPASADELRGQCEDLVLAEDGYREALRRKLDAEPRFVEDRANFLANQAFDLFEREVVKPGAVVTDEEVAGFYQAHTAEYHGVRCVEGRLLRFRTNEEAFVCVRRAGETSAPVAWPASAVSCESFTLSRSRFPEEMPFLPGMVFGQLSRRAYGPFAAKDLFVVWVTDRVLPPESLPLADVADMIRNRLGSERVVAAEARLARQVAPAFRVDEHIDYASFGLSRPPSFPWVARDAAHFMTVDSPSSTAGSVSIPDNSVREKTKEDKHEEDR